MDAIWGAVTKLLKWFSDVFVAIFKAAWDFLGDVVCWAFDGCMDIVVKAVNALDLSGLVEHTSDWSGMPQDIVNIMQLAGLGTASGIVITAIGIRLVLQLIPFTRLGS